MYRAPIKNNWKNTVDWSLIICYLMLVLFGWVNIYASIHSGEPSKSISDSGVAVKWEPVSAQGREFVSYYGIKNDAISTSDLTGKTNVVSPQTSVPAAAGITALFAAAVAAAAGCVVIGRKEKKDE